MLGPLRLCCQGGCRRFCQYTAGWGRHSRGCCRCSGGCCTTTSAFAGANTTASTTAAAAGAAAPGAATACRWPPLVRLHCKELGSMPIACMHGACMDLSTLDKWAAREVLFNLVREVKVGQTCPGSVCSKCHLCFQSRQCLVRPGMVGIPQLPAVGWPTHIRDDQTCIMQRSAAATLQGSILHCFVTGW